ncbi:non-ribosomal peptide synthetase [Staphylococcus borealis]|uniref:non-ribosomal peptide synthetase n=1 Tax=Staphylococcus borealis TaxID=2742203 RepID=UPI002DB63197|nr:amino acid adenylation domain-containing protein [Staphylococcus borealis]MEB7367612.1 amino acid adenylation domain-containing protein [Staphylococcus borealis]
MINILNEFKKCVEEVPDKIAIYDKKNNITYKQLDNITTLLANRLLQYNIQYNKVIPLYLEPSKEIIITILALYKIGLAYTPISIKFPENRVELLIEDTESNILITDREVSVFNNKLTIINILKELEYLHEIDTSNYKDIEKIYKITPKKLAYIIYTSGSTGKPKGVKINHSNLNNLLVNMQKYYPINSEDTYILSTPYTFDVSVVEIFSWILGRGSLYITNPESDEDLKTLFKQVVKNNITHMALSPALLNLLLSVNDYETMTQVDRCLKYLMIAGEEFKPDLANKVKKLLPNVFIDNLYGPTENSVYTTRYRLEDKVYEDYVPIGKPLDNIQTHLLNDNNSPCGEGELGHLYISGKSLSDGYYNDLEKTEKSFIKNNEQVLYKSGDLCKFDSDKNLIFIRRVDNQVQINGIRVELEEIENSIMKNISDIQNCKVLYKDNALICFYTHANMNMKFDLKIQVQKLLPSYMIPQYFLEIEEFPLNINRKIDNKKLLEFFEDYSGYNQIKNEYLTDIELRVKNIISKVFNKDSKSISKNDDFFSTLGADSLQNITCVIYLENEFNLRLEDGFLYRYSTIKKISNYIKSMENNYADKNNEPLILPTIEYYSKIENHLNSKVGKGSYEKLKGIHSTYYLQKVYHYDNFESIISVDIKFPKETHDDEIKKRINVLVENNEMLRTIIVESKGSIKFFEYCIVDPPIFNLKLPLNYGSKRYNEVKANLIKIVEDDIYGNLLNNLLYRIIVIDNNDNKEVIFVLSHHISDYSNIHVIKKQFFKPSRPQHTYFDFVDFMNSRSNSKNIDNISLIEELKAVGEQKLEIEKDNNNEFVAFKYKLSNLDSRSNNDTVTFINYVISQMICDGLHKQSISISTILNIRQLKTLEFNDNIGDFHFSLTTIGKKEESYSDFLDRVEIIKNDYINGFNIMNNIFNTYPNMNDTQKYLEELYDINPTLKTNYLGQIREENIDDIIEQLKITKVQLNKFPISKIYVTFFTTNEYVYIVFLSRPVISDALIEKYGFETYDI